MKLSLNESVILEFLSKIEKGEITLKALLEPDIVYAGNVPYVASNGWHIIIFNDANTWDYIDSIKIDETNFIEFDELDKYPSIRNYTPPLEVIKNAYNIPQVE